MCATIRRDVRPEEERELTLDPGWMAPANVLTVMNIEWDSEFEWDSILMTSLAPIAQPSSTKNAWIGVGIAKTFQSIKWTG